MNDEEKAICEMRELSKQFIAKNIEFDLFFEQMIFILGQDFDQIEDYIDRLKKDHQTELLFYNKMTGGDSSQDESEIPKNLKWVYGDSSEKYGWIDKERFYSLYKTEFGKIIKI